MINHLTQLAKALPKDSVRSYAKTISVKPGKACITDGYCLLIHKNHDYQDEKVFDKNLKESAANFPNYQTIIDSFEKEKRRVLSFEDCQDILLLLKAIGAKGQKDIYLNISQKRIEKHSQNTDIYINPWLINNMRKGIPKNLKIESILFNNEMVEINFELDFKILICTIKIH